MESIKNIVNLHLNWTSFSTVRSGEKVVCNCKKVKRIWCFKEVKAICYQLLKECKNNITGHMNGKPTWTQKCWVLSCVWSGWVWSCWRTCSRGSRSTEGSHSPSTLRFNGSKGFSCNGSSPVRSWHFAVKHCILGLWFIVHAVKARDMLHHRHEFQFEERERERVTLRKRCNCGWEDGSFVTSKSGWGRYAEKKYGLIFL